MDTISPKIFYKLPITSTKVDKTSTRRQSRALSPSLNLKVRHLRNSKQASVVSNKKLRNAKREVNSCALTLRSRKLSFNSTKVKEKCKISSKKTAKVAFTTDKSPKALTGSIPMDKNNFFGIEQNTTIGLGKNELFLSNLQFLHGKKSSNALSAGKQFDENNSLSIDQNPNTGLEKTKLPFSDKSNYCETDQNPTVVLERITEKLPTKSFRSKIPIPINRSNKGFNESKPISGLSSIQSIENINLKSTQRCESVNMFNFKSVNKDKNCDDVRNESALSGAESIIESISSDINNIVQRISFSTVSKETDKDSSLDRELVSKQNEIFFNSNYESMCHNSTEISASTENTVTASAGKFCTSYSLTNESLSEYLPDSTFASETITSNNKSLENVEKSLMVITSPLNITKINIPYSTESKRHFCIFCKSLQTNLARHLLLKHKSENEIKAISTLPKKHNDRINLFNRLRKEGDFLHNTTESLNTGILIVSRQQYAKAKNNPDDYACCKKCKGFFSKKTLRIHLKQCNKEGKNNRSNLICSRRMTQYIHQNANEIMKTKIFPVLRNDEITSSIRYDDLLITFGNKLSEKYSLNHQHDMIRSHLRLLGRFKLALINLRPEVQMFKEIYKPQIYNDCIKALRTVANWDSDLMWFKTPAVAQSLTSLIKKCGYKQRTEYIKTQEDGPKKDVEDFLLLWEEEIPTLINKKALEDQANYKRVKKTILPSKEDIKKLYDFLKNKMCIQIKVLDKRFCTQSWNELIKATLIFIQIFNRRRAGEIERLTISNYENKEIITDNLDKEQMRNISQESLELAKQFARITIRGKLGRTVSVLLSPLSVSAIDTIIKYRVAAGIPSANDHIFCKTGFSKLSKQYFRACPLLKQFSTECGAVFPESLRGTYLRKHIATYTSLLNVEDATIDTLANFMGHHKEIHKTVYRISVPVNEVTCVSKLLMSAICDANDEGGKEGDKAGEGLNETCGIVVEENLRNNELDFTSPESSESEESSRSEKLPKKKRRSTSPYGKTKRSRWTKEEKQAIISHFGCLKDLEKLPSLTECLNICRKFTSLKRRTPQQVKTWIDNQRRYK